MELAHREPERAVDRWAEIQEDILVAREAFDLKTSVSNEQVALALLKCKKQGLDPFAGECYLIPYAGRLTVQVSIHALLARAMRNPLILRFSDAILIGKDEKGDLVRRPLCHAGGFALLGAAVTAHFKDGNSQEYVMPAGMYGKEATPKLPYMLGKAALANACRKACPLETGGLHAEGEFGLEPGENNGVEAYDLSELHRDRYPELAQVGLTIESANRILGKYTDRASHEKALDELLDARHAEQQKDDKPADDKPAREREPGDDDVEMDDIDLGPETEMMQLDLTGGDDG